MSTKHHTVSPATQIFNPQVERAIPASTSQLHSITAILLVFSSHPTGGRRLSWPGLPVTHFPGQLLSGCVRWLVRYLHVAGWCQLGSYLLQLSLSSLTKWPLMEGMSQPLCRLSIAQVEIWPLTCLTHTHTHIHTQPFYGSLDFVQDNPGEPIPESTFRHLLDFLEQNEDNTDRCTNNLEGLPPHPDYLVPQPLPSPPFLHRMPFLTQPSQFILAWTGTKYAGLHTRWLTCLKEGNMATNLLVRTSVANWQLYNVYNCIITHRPQCYPVHCACIGTDITHFGSCNQTKTLCLYLPPF